tara:strand:- start:4038 stop:5450 length:1413 start_codon:yes stop_codon:yes gene_type:complete
MDTGTAYNPPKRNAGEFNSLDYYLENNKVLTYLEADDLYSKNTDEPMSYADMISNWYTYYEISFNEADATENEFNTLQQLFIYPYSGKNVIFNTNTIINSSKEIITPACSTATFNGALQGNATTATLTSYAPTITDASQPLVSELQNITTVGTKFTLTSDTVNATTGDIAVGASTVVCNRVNLPSGASIDASVVVSNSADVFKGYYGDGKAFQVFLRPLAPYGGAQQVKPSMECKYIYDGSGDKEASVCDLRHQIQSFHAIVQGVKWAEGSANDKTDYGWIKNGNNMYMMVQTPSTGAYLACRWKVSSSGTSWSPELVIGASGTGLDWNLQILASVDVNVAGTKSFTIKSPIKEDHSIRHSCVESPRYDNIYRDEITLIDGYAEVNIDTHFGMMVGTFLALNREFSIYTSNQTSFTRLKSSLEGNVLKITAKEPTADVVSFMVIGERHDSNIMNCSASNENGKLILEKIK